METWSTYTENMAKTGRHKPEVCPGCWTNVRISGKNLKAFSRKPQNTYTNKTTERIQRERNIYEKKQN